MDNVQWPQEIGLVKPNEEIAPNTCSRAMLDRRARPQKDQALNCPRCNSTNTKFCYYNNYSLTQPRYFCKGCRRYWTEGGSLRNVPVGGGSRKNKRSTSSSSSSSSSSALSQKLPDLNPPGLSQFSSQNPKIHEGQDLNLVYPATHDYHGIFQFVKLPKIEDNNSNLHNSSTSSTSSPLSALDLLRTGIASSTGLNSMIPMPMQMQMQMTMPNSNTPYSSGFPFQDLKPTLGFSVDGLGSNRYGSLHGVQENGGRLLFPFAELKQLSSSSEVDPNKGQGNSTGYWNGMFSGASW